MLLGTLRALDNEAWSILYKHNESGFESDPDWYSWLDYKEDETLPFLVTRHTFLYIQCVHVVYDSESLL